MHNCNDPIRYEHVIEIASRPRVERLIPAFALMGSENHFRMLGEESILEDYSDKLIAKMRAQKEKYTPAVLDARPQTNGDNSLNVTSGLCGLLPLESIVGPEYYTWGFLYDGSYAIGAEPIDLFANAFQFAATREYQARADSTLRMATLRLFSVQKMTPQRIVGLPARAVTERYLRQHAKERELRNAAEFAAMAAEEKKSPEKMQNPDNRFAALQGNNRVICFACPKRYRL